MKKLSIFALALISLIASAQNLIENGNFEEGLKNWTIPSWKAGTGREWLTPQIDTAVVHGSGSQSLRLDYKANLNPVIYYKHHAFPIPVTPGKVYTLSFWTKSTGYDTTTRGQCILKLRQLNEKKLHAITTPWNLLQDDWTLFSKDFTFPEGCTSVELAINLFGHKNTKGTCWIDDIYFGPKETAETAVQNEKPDARLFRTVSTEKHGGIYYPGEEIIYNAEICEVANPGDKATLDVTVLDFDEKPLYHTEQEIVLPENKPMAKKGLWAQLGFPTVTNFPVKLVLDKDFRGWFAVKAKLIKNGKAVSRVTGAGMVVDEIQEKRDPFFCSVNNSREKRVRMGIGSVEVQLHRKYMEKGEHKYDFSGSDKQVDSLLKEGMKPFLSITFHQGGPGNHPAWLRKTVQEKKAKGINPYDDAFFKLWEDFFRACVSRYSDRVHTWATCEEVYNTYTTDKYELPYFLKCSHIMSKVVKEGHPENKYFGGGCFMDMSPIGKDIWKELGSELDGLIASIYLQKNAVGKGYVLNGPEAGGMLERFRFTASIIGEKTPIMNAETGYCFLNYPEIDSEQVKETAPINARNLILARSLGTVKCWKYFLIDNDLSYEIRRKGSVDYGMWNIRTGGPKPLAATHAVCTRVLAWVTDPVDASPRKDVYCYVFKKEGKTLAAFWALSKDPVSAKVNLPSDWTGVDFMGMKFSGKKGANEFQISERPIYLTFTAPQDEVVKAFKNSKCVMPEVNVSLNRKDQDNMNVFIQNKLDATMKAEVSLNGGKAQTISLKPLALEIVPMACKPGNTVKASVKVNGVVYTAEKKDEVYPVKFLAGAPAMDGTLKGFESVNPLVLDGYQFVQPFDAAEYKQWKDASDLSAKVYTAYDKDFFYFAADVTDDVHVTRQTGMYIWNQDAIQIGFNTGNDAFDNNIGVLGYRPDDREFALGLGKNGSEIFCHTGAPGQRSQPMSYKTIVSRNGDHTIYVTAIPWAGLGKLKPVPGMVFGFNFVIMDVDEAKAPITYHMEFAPGITDGKNPCAFKRFILEK